MDPIAILSLILFAALAVAFVAFVRRASALVARIRVHERFQREIAELESRTGAAIDPLLTRIEELRRHQAHPDQLLGTLPEVTESVRGLAAAAQRLSPIPAFADVPGELADALIKAERALGLIDHGATGLAASRSTPRELEAQTSLKRGALALRNARAEAGAIARRVAETPPPGASRRLGGQGGRTPERVGSRLVVDPPPATLARPRDGGSDPSM